MSRWRECHRSRVAAILERACSRLRCGLAAAVVRVAVGAFALVHAGCSTAPERHALAHADAQPGYFVEFRARSGNYFGHTYIVYGRVNAAGRNVEYHHVGLIPDGEFWAAGLLLPVRGAVRPFPDDEAMPVAASYSRHLTAQEYRRLHAKVRQLRRTESWQFFLHNCNDFASDIASTLNLRTPPSLLPPPLWVGALGAMNDG